MCAGGPDLLAVDAPAFGGLARRGPHRCEVGPRAGFGQADAGVELAFRDARQIALALLFAAVTQDQRAGLTVGDPVRANGGARRQQFLDHDITFERMAVAAAIARRQRHPDIARGTERAAETGVETHPAIRPRHQIALQLVHRKPGPQIGAQCGNVARRIERIERKALHVAPAMQ